MSANNTPWKDVFSKLLEHMEEDSLAGMLQLSGQAPWLTVHDFKPDTPISFIVDINKQISELSETNSANRLSYEGDEEVYETDENEENEDNDTDYSGKITLSEMIDCLGEEYWKEVCRRFEQFRNENKEKFDIKLNDSVFRAELLKGARDYVGVNFAPVFIHSNVQQHCPSFTMSVSDWEMEQLDNNSV